MPVPSGNGPGESRVAVLPVKTLELPLWRSAGQPRTAYLSRSSRVPWAREGQIVTDFTPAATFPSRPRAMFLFPRGEGSAIKR